MTIHSFRLILAAIVCATGAMNQAFAADDAGRAPSGEGANWKVLFDGKTLDGWHKNPERIGHGTGGKWEVEDGAIVGSQDPPGNGGILLSNETYGDFELVLELKPDWGIDSGLFLRSTPKGECFQMMVDYHEDGNVGHIYGEGTGGFTNRPFNIFGVYDAKKQLVSIEARDNKNKLPEAYSISGADWAKSWKVNDWNTAAIRMTGSPAKITTWINGAKVTEFDGGNHPDPQYKADAVAKTLGERGSIALQIHGGTGAWPAGAKGRWKNIRVKPL